LLMGRGAPPGRRSGRDVRSSRALHARVPAACADPAGHARQSVHQAARIRTHGYRNLREALILRVSDRSVRRSLQRGLRRSGRRWMGPWLCLDHSGSEAANGVFIGAHMGGSIPPVRCLPRFSCLRPLEVRGSRWAAFR
jgi:hypothetical protein